MVLFTIIMSILTLIIIWAYRLNCKLEKEKKRIEKEREKLFYEMLNFIKQFKN